MYLESEFEVNPLVSIIMPAYNSADTLAESIRSVLSQSYPHWELLIVNDGSQDSTPDIAASFSHDPRIILISQPNKGVATARNAGIARSKGTYVAFLDSDDLWNTNKLAKQIAFFQSSGNPKLGMVHSDYVIFRQDIGKSWHRPMDMYDYLSIKNNYHRLLLYCYIGTLTVMIKKDVLNDVGIFDESLFGTEDWDLWLRIAQKYDIEMIDMPLAFYREHSKGISKKRDIHFQNELKIINKYGVYNTGIPSKIIRLSLWLLNGRKVRYHFIRKEYFQAILYYYKMIVSMPFNPLNIALPLARLYELFVKSKKEKHGGNS